MDRAEKQGVHVIYTGEYHTLRSEMKTAARDDPYMPEEVRSEIDSVIHALGAAERARDRIVERSAALADRLARRREVPDSEWSRDERAFLDRKAYDPWRRDTEKAVEAAETRARRPDALRRPPPGPDAPRPPIRAHGRARGAGR